MDIKNEIIRITSEYLEDNLDYHRLSVASKEYKNILNKLCDESLDTDIGRDDLQLENGKALGTFWAASCIDDLIRTRTFIRGINKAIKEQVNEKRKVHILYAGTGPFATLLLPLMLRYSKSNIKYTLLEVNPFSFDTLKTVFLKIGLEEYDINLVKEDATKYQIGNDTPDIIISETMQNALDKEQQVSIFYNLMSQVPPDSVFIPEKIILSIGLKQAGIPVEELQREHYHIQKKVFEVSKETIAKTLEAKNLHNEELTFPKTQTIINKKELHGINQIVLTTDIQVFKDEKIILNESSLTIPKIIDNVSDYASEDIVINTQYIVHSEPKLEIQIE